MTIMTNEKFIQPYRKSVYGVEPRKRAASLPEIVSLKVRELFPEIPKEIYLQYKDISAIREATQNALAKVNMDMIRPEDSVNILCTQHGFVILGGEPYAEMIRTIKDVVQERTGCKDIRLRVATGLRWREPNEIIDYFKFDKYFNGRAVGILPVDKGVPIDTEIGTLYGIARAYDADWFIHSGYSDLRELYWHRMIDRALKPFAMGYARLETRGVDHFNFGPRSSNFIQRAIFNSPFIQQKFAFASFLMTTPAGIIGVDADNDLNKFDRRETVFILRYYGKLVRLLNEIGDCIPVLDSAVEVMYMFAGGVTFGNLVNGHLDYFDLETVPPSTGFGIYGGERKPGAPKVTAVNPALKALVVNYVWKGMMMSELAINIPTIVVGKDLADMLIGDSMNSQFMDYAVTAESLETALKFARRITKTDNIIVFDGSFGSINLTPQLADVMLKKAPEVSRNVEEVRLPKWLRQRGFDPQQLSTITS